MLTNNINIKCKIVLYAIILFMIFFAVFLFRTAGSYYMRSDVMRTELTGGMAFLILIASLLSLPIRGEKQKEVQIEEPI